MATILEDRSRRRASDVSSKDSTEEELERLIFGDSAGFRDNLRAFKEDASAQTTKDLVLAEDSEEDGEDRTGLEGLADKDLFFLDDGPGAPVQPIEVDGEESDAVSEGDKAAWSDSDDERITISLTSRTQLRKLRRSEADDIITGKEYSRRLRKQFQLLNPVPAWVKEANRHVRKKRRTSSGSEVTDSSGDEGMDLDDEGALSAQPLARLLQDVSSLSRTKKPKDGERKKRRLQPNAIDIQKMQPFASSGPSSVTCLQVHPSLPLVISSGPSKTISLHHLQPQPPDPNPLLTTLHLKHTPLHTTLFHPSPTSSKLFFAGRRKYMHTWDLSTGSITKTTRLPSASLRAEQRSWETFRLSPTGAHIALLGTSRKAGGVLNILSADSMQWIAQARIDSVNGIADFAWWRDGSGITVVAKGGEVTEWDLEARAAVARWKDEGAVGTTTLALGGESGRKTLGGDRWVAIGSASGIVNVYDRRAWSADNSGLNVPPQPKPVRVLDQLVTEITALTFSPCGQVLCMASKWKKNALRLVHLPSCIVYANWPTQKTPLGRVTSVAFGEDAEGTLALVVGNESGAVRGWCIRD